MKRSAFALLLIFSLSVVTVQILTPANGGTLSKPLQAPEFTHNSENEWINAKPLMLSELRDKVVLIDFWTFDCWNCYRSFPWLKSMEARLQPQGLQVVGVHTPEFDHEKIRDNIVTKVKEFGLHHPIMIDNDFTYWRAMGNRYWPAFYIIGKKGNIRGIFYGETHEGDSRAKQIEKLLLTLLAE